MRSVAIAPELIELLWPHAHLVRGRGNQDERLEILCLPSTTNARSLIPLKPASVPAGVLTRRFNGRGPRGTAKRMALMSLLRAGVVTRGQSHVAHLLPRSVVGLAEFVSEHLQQDIIMAVHIGAPRANQKPVLELMDGTGRAVAFGKLGVNPLTDQLVRAETSALTVLASRRLPHVMHPTVLARLSWQGHPLLLQSPLPVERATRPPAALVATAAREVAGPSETHRGYLSESGFFSRLSARLSSLPPSEVGELLNNSLLALASERARLSFCAWHGDWTPWNMAAAANRLMVWDWERYDSEVPEGFDQLHHAFQSAVQRNPRGAPVHARKLVARAPQVLGWMDELTARATTRLYFLEIASRYLKDGQAQSGGRLGHVLPWAAAALTSTQPRFASNDPRRSEVRHEQHPDSPTA